MLSGYRTHGDHVHILSKALNYRRIEINKEGKNDRNKWNTLYVICSISFWQWYLNVQLKHTRASFRVQSTTWVGHSLRNRQYIVSFNRSPLNWIWSWMDAIRLLLFQPLSSLFLQCHGEYTSSFHRMEIRKIHVFE